MGSEGIGGGGVCTFWEISSKKLIAKNAHQHTNQYLSAELWLLSLEQ